MQIQKEETLKIDLNKSKRKSRVQALLDKKINNPDAKYFAHMMIGVSEERFEKLGFNPEHCQPVGFKADIRKLDHPLWNRIALGLGTAPAPYYPDHVQYGGFIFKNAGGELIVYQWDEIGDEETAEDYLKRHFSQMDIKEIVLLPKEPNFMQTTVATRWANRIGFPIPHVTVRRFVDKKGVTFGDVRHLHTERFFNYLHEWGKRPGESPYEIAL